MTGITSTPVATTTATTLTRRRPRDDTVVDVALDYLRDHRLSPAVETVAAWLVAGGCLLYYGGSYLVSCFVSTGSRRAKRVPLMTDVRSREACTEEEAAQLEREVETRLLPFAMESLQSSAEGQDKRDLSSTLLPDEQLVKLIRQDSSLRRLVSRVMTTTVTNIKRRWILYNALDRVWSDLLRLPPIQSGGDSGGSCGGDDIDQSYEQKYSYEISLIIPAYRERGSQVASTLRHALQMCDEPHLVEVVVVDAGACVALEHALADFIHHDDDHHHGQGVAPDGGTGACWAKFLIKQYQGEAGRGSCLNFGVDGAGGTLLTFLHSDTRVPEHWDTKVKAMFVPGRFKNKLVQACAFSFGHDTSQEGLNGLPYPWGINAIWFLANLRASWFRLPYGDHVISMPAAYFRYLGGYPNQPIMEDYELMDLLRQRATILPEQIRIIPRPTARCSVRRWQKFGVAYVTLVNAVLVHRYAHCGWLAQDIFDYYYCRSSSEQRPQ